jgi:lycopene cyclase domain-containing protein
VPGEYTIGAVVAPLLVVALELLVLRTGVLATRRFWAAMAIVFAFQVPMDGWLTWLRAPVVLYRDDAITGLRWPLDIPVEDFGFGFALVGLTIVLWTWQARRDAERNRADPVDGEPHR